MHEGPKPNLTYKGGTFEHEGEPIRTLEVSGENPKGRTVLIAPGLAESADNFTETGGALASRGRNVRILSPRMNYDKKKIRKEMQAIKKETKARYPKLEQGLFDALWNALPEAEVAKALALIAYAESNRKDDERFDAIGHSQGGANLLIAAFLRPDLFGHIILVNPAGQSGKEVFGGLNGLFMRFFKALLKESNKKGKRHLLSGAAHFLILRGMFGRAVGEARALANFDAFPLLYALSFAEPPVMRTTIYDSSDPIFRQSDVERAEDDSSTEHGTPKETEPFGARLITKDMGHYHPVTHPDEFAELADEILSK